MTGGIIQLAAKGFQDIFLVDNPQITLFKTVYRRHTNFSIEVIPQLFTHTPDFGRKITCIISRSGDLLSKMYLVIKLPALKPFLNNDGSTDEITRAAWTKKVGFAIIKMIEIEIGGQMIDRQYGEWLHIWNELTGTTYTNYLKMIGLDKNINEYTNGKDSYTLYIPLQFWFCKYRSLAIPILNLQNNEIKVNVELSVLDKCLNVTPTHYINIHEDLVNFIKDEYIEQTINDEKAFGIVRSYDVLTKRLYYHRLSRTTFKSIQNTTITNAADLANVLNDPNNQKYLIRGESSSFTVMPFINSSETVHPYNKQRNISVADCFMLIDYIYLDDEERVKFSQAKHEYLIEQLNTTTEKTINTSNRRIDLEMRHPVKLLTYVTQQSYLKDTRVNDHFNYTNDYHQTSNYVTRDIKPYTFQGTNLITNANILLNGQERLTFRSSNYFNWIQPYQHFQYAPDNGINVYSFGLFPDKHQPSGTSNMSKIDNVSVQLRMDPIVGFNNDAKFRSYFITLNILRIMNGLSNIVFTN